MPTKQIRYRCDICDTIYETLKKAEKCESQGVMDLSKIPVGLMTGKPTNTQCHHQHNMTSAVASCRALYRSHCFTISHWACRDRPFGDSLGDETYDSGVYNRLTWPKLQHIPLTIDDLNHSTWIRMENWLIQQGITPTCLINGQIVTVVSAREQLGDFFNEC